MKIKENKKIYIIISLILVFILLFCFSVFNNKIGDTKASVFEISNDNIKMSINDTEKLSDNTSSFYFLDLKTIKLTVDFEDNTSEDKRIEIDLCEGLTYKLYPVLLEAGDDLQTVIPEDNNLYDAITSVNFDGVVKETSGYTDTKQGKYVEYSVANGKLIYYVKKNISRVELNINVAVDWQKQYPALKNDETGLYKNKILEDAIRVTAYKNNTQISVLSSNVEVKMEDNLEYSLITSSKKFSNQVFSSLSNKTNYGYTKATNFQMLLKHKAEAAERWGFYGIPDYEEMTYTFYYPKDAEFDSVVFGFENYILCKNGEASVYDVTCESRTGENENRVILTLNKNGKKNLYRIFKYPLSVKYKMKTADEIWGNNKDHNDIVWTTSNKDSVQIKFYDGTTRTYYSANGHSLTIIHPEKFINKMNIQFSNDIYEDNNDNTFVYGPSFVVENFSPGIKTNQVLEYIIDPKYQAIAVTFPRKGDAPIEIWYQTTVNSNWQKYTAIEDGIQNDKFNNFNFTITKTGLKDAYFTKVKAFVDSYEENYVSSSSAPKAHNNAVVYGNLKSVVPNNDGKISNEALVTFRMYDKNDTSVMEINSNENIDNIALARTEVRSTKKVIYTDKLEIGSNPNIAYFAASENATKEEKISKVAVGEEFYIIGDLIPNKYPYGTRIYIDNAEIYLRQPTGLTLEINDLKLKDKDGNEIDYEVVKTVNKYGETVYKLITEKTIGYGLSKQESLDNVYQYIKIKAKYSVNSNCELNKIELHDLLVYGNERYTILDRGRIDIKDVDADKNSDDKIVDVSADEIMIEPRKNFSILSYVKKDGKTYAEYNENNSDTIIDLKPNDIFEYVFNIKNNSEDSIDSYELYIPIAKKETNYGIDYQKQAFNFDISLAEILETNDLYDVYYSKDKDTKNIINPEKMNYSNNISSSDLPLVTMVKIVSKKKINIGEEYTFNLKLKVDKNKGISESQLNINSILYHVSSSTLAGKFNGNSNAFRLYAPSISGYVFNDLNLDKKYDNKDIPIVGNVSLELYKLNNNQYEKVTDINVDSKNGYFEISDTNILGKNIYALKVNVEGYNIYSDITEDGWIKDISLLESKSYYYEIGYIKYDIDFNIEDKIIGMGKKEEISIKDLRPSYFDLIKNEESTYNWYVSEEDSSYLKVNDKNSPSIEIEGLKETKEDVKLCVQVVDRYNNRKEKCAKVKVKESLAPVVKAKDVHILVGSKIKYEEYLKEAVDYKDNKINLNFNKNVKVTSDIAHENGIATKVGEYDVIYEVTDDYGNVGTAKIKIYVDPISAIITNPSTYDNVIINVIIIIISLVTVIITSIFIHKKRYRK